ncbi:MAG TPA: hypothetical protein VI111_04180 [Thermoleophilaceae bacterium]
MTHRVGIALGLLLLGVLAFMAPTAGASITVRGGHIKIDVSCAAGSARSCAGVVSLRRTVGGHKRVLGKKRYSAAPGGSQRVRIKLNKLGRRLLEKRPALGATLRWTTSGAPTLSKSVRLVG